MREWIGEKMRIIMLLLAGALGVPLARAQTANTLRAIVLDAAASLPVSYATVSVLRDTGTRPVSGALADSEGRFSVVLPGKGTYRLLTDFIGYRRDTTRILWNGPAAQREDTLRLFSASRTLGDVVISARAPVVENKIDRIVFNAAADLSSQGGTTLDLLRKVPQVTVDIDGNVELQGNPNVRFLINGKPSSLFGASLADALASIPASQIQRIEAITTPGARYDAQGTGGIINIILKESRVQGYNGSVSLSAGTRFENGALNLSVRHGALGLNAFFAGNAQLPSHTLTRQDRSSRDTTTGGSNRLLQDGYYDFSRAGYNGGLGADWAVSKRSTFTGGVSMAHFNNHNNGAVAQQALAIDKAGTQLSNNAATRNSDSRFHTTSLDWNLGYHHNFSKPEQTLDVLYSASYAMPQASYGQSQIGVGQPLPTTGSRSNSPGTDLQTNLSADYAQPLGENASLECGVKTIFQTIRSSATVSTLQGAGADYLADPTQSYALRYNMAVYAAYASASFSVGKWLDVKAGLRYEHTGVTIDFPGTRIPAYDILAPTAILSHKWTNGNLLKLAYTRRIERAEYDELNPFVNRSDPFNLLTGNPLLMPELGNHMELGWSKSFNKGSNLSISLIERINTSDHKRVVTFYNSYRVGDSVFRDVSVQRVLNAGVEYNTGINISGSLRLLGEVFTLRGNTMLMQQYFAPSVAGLRGGFIGLRFRSNLNIAYQPPHSLFAAEVFGNYNAPTQNVQGRTQQNLSYTLAVRRLLWKKKGSIGITMTNPFNRYVPQVTTINTPGYTSYVERQVPYQSFGVVFGYRFGRLERKKEREENSGFQNSMPGE